MKAPTWLAIALSAIIGASGAPVDAQETQPNTANGNMLDLSVPESPAFTALGLTPQAVSRPASPRELATGLLNGLDANGNFQSGLAVDVSPYLLFAGDGLDIQEYWASYPRRLLARFQVSLATVKGAENEDEATRIALGFRATPFDLGDPRLDRALAQCFTDDLQFTTPPALPPSMGGAPTAAASVAGASAAREAAAKGCRTASRKRNWNRSAWDIGVAPTWTSEDGSIGDLKGTGVGVWTSGAYGFEGIPFLEETSQVIAHAKYRTKEFVPDPMMEGSLLEQDSALVGARIRVGAEWAALSLEGAWTHADPRGRRASDSYRVSGGGEIRLASNVWLVLSVGEQGEQGDRDSEGFVLSSLKWGLSGERTLGQ